jgi:hypothetical protein
VNEAGHEMEELKMQSNGMRLAVLVMLIAPNAWAAATPMDAPLKEDGVTTIECDVADKTETMVVFKNTAEDPTKSTKTEGYHYDLYLPKGYQANKDFCYPCIFIADAGGNANMGAAAERLKRDEWIAVMLHESRNGTCDWLRNFQAAHDDVVKRVRVAKGAKFATGFSGGARCSSINAMVRPGFAGVICQAAAFAQQFEGMWETYAVYPPCILVAGTFGSTDGNITELQKIRRNLRSSRVDILLFDGGHGHCPGPVFESCLDWMEEELFVTPLARPEHFAQPLRPVNRGKDNRKAFEAEPLGPEAFRWYYRKAKRLLGETKEGPARYLALGRILAVVQNGRLGQDKEIGEAAKAWQEELQKLKAVEAIRNFEQKEYFAYRTARATEDAYNQQMRMGRVGDDGKTFMSAADKQGLERTIAAYRAVVETYPDCPFAAECKLKLTSLEIERPKAK